MVGENNMRRRFASPQRARQQPAATGGAQKGAEADSESLPKWAVVALGLFIAVMFAPVWYMLRDATSGDGLDDLAARAGKVMGETPLVDGHNDFPYMLRLELQNQIYDEGVFNFSHLGSHTDLVKLKQGRVGGQFWSVFVECPSSPTSQGLEDSGQPNLDAPTHSIRDTLEQIDVAKRLIDLVPELHYCETSACADMAFRRGQVASMLGAEGLHQAGDSLAVVRQLFALGVRYITVTHNCDNAFAASAHGVETTKQTRSRAESRGRLADLSEDGGLTDLGRAAVREMNRLGMMVDLAHASHQTMRDVLDISASPVIFSHGACYALGPGSTRNAPDDVIARLRDNGGVLMVMFVKRFLDTTNLEAADIETVVDHIMHVVAVTGSWRHVGLGGDFDGCGDADLADGIASVADYPQVVEAVMRRGATDEQVRMLLGENIMRVWRQNEVYAKAVALTMKPAEDFWEGRKWPKWIDILPDMIPGNPRRVR